MPRACETRLFMPRTARGYSGWGVMGIHAISLKSRQPMHRLLLTFLLVFMPFQAIWAAASPYCGHEAASQVAEVAEVAQVAQVSQVSQVAQVAHFGHHEHKHGHDADATADHADSTEPSEAVSEKALTSATAVHLDCHACHGAGTGVALSTGAQALVVSVVRPAAHVAPAWMFPPLSRPERPNWPVLA